MSSSIRIPNYSLSLSNLICSIHHVLYTNQIFSRAHKLSYIWIYNILKDSLFVVCAMVNSGYLYNSHCLQHKHGLGEHVKLSYYCIPHLTLCTITLGVVHIYYVIAFWTIFTPPPPPSVISFTCIAIVSKLH